MEIILLEKIDNVGAIGDRVKVKSGYARNFLIPQGKATVATPENIAKFEARRAELEKKAAGELDVAQKRAKTLEALTLRIEAQAGGPSVRLDRHERHRRCVRGAGRRYRAQRGALAKWTVAHRRRA